MPHAIRRVVVARTARTTAGIALSIGGAMFLAVASSARLANALASVMPGIQPAAVATMLSAAWVLGVGAYLWSRARSEHRFAVAMSHYVLPGGDRDYDLQRLDHEHPDQMARGMAHRREVASATWLVIGAAMVVPASALYVLEGVATHRWPQMAGFEHALASHASLLIVYAFAGVLGALAMTMRITREPRAAWTLFAIAFAIVVASCTVHSLVPAALAVVPVTMALIVRRLRRERIAIAAEDPAAGSELFSFRDTLRSLWTVTRAGLRLATTPQGVRAIVAIVVIAGGWQYLHRSKAPAHAATPQIVQTNPVAPSVVPQAHNTPHYQITQQGPTFKVDIDLDGSAVEIDGIGGLASIPENWSAQIDVSTSTPVLVTPFLEDSAQSFDHTYRFTKDACGMRPVALGLRVVPTRNSAEHVTVFLTPQLAPTECPILGE